MGPWASASKARPSPEIAAPSAIACRVPRRSRWRPSIGEISAPIAKRMVMPPKATVGVRPGQPLLVHSSFDRFAGFSGKVSDVIAALQRAVGEEGILMMPTMPFMGSAVAWAREHPRVDLRREPSRMGLISEAFRRSPGVVRSVHPTHPVALWGRDAGEWAAGHPLATSPCGRGSPYFRLLECGGDVLLLGARITDLTLFHTLEELLEPRMPLSPFTRERFVFDCRGLLNPGRIEYFKTLTGRDKAVKDYLEQQTKMPEFLNSIFDIVDISVEDYIRRGFESLSVSFGCTGGQHRSVYAADALARHLKNKFKVKIELEHLIQDKKNWINLPPSRSDGQ